MAETRGRRPEWNDYKKFNQAVDEYFERCEKENVFPDYAGMLLHLKIDKDQAKSFVAEGAPDADEFRRAFNIAALRRESWLARHMVVDNKAANGCMNALKQLENGGYTDGRSAKASEAIKVKVEGLAGGEASFQ